MKYKSHAEDQKRRRKIYKGFVDARGVATRQAVRHFGVLADRAYFGARGTCKTGVKHFG